MKIPQNLGATGSGKKLELHKDAVTQGFADFGKRGKGKSNLAACMMEIFASRGESFVVLDPPDAHWGIRFAADEDGKPVGPSGFDVLLIGGDHGDVALDPRAGKELAQIIVEGDISAVIGMRALGYTDRQRFCADFAEELFRLNRTPRHIFFEEAQNFTPQTLKFDEQKRVLYAMEKLIDEGRGQGIGFTLISQRPALINKNVLEQVDNFFALGMIGPNDLEQMKNWFKHHVGRDKEKLEAIVEDLATMKQGDCWFLSPEWLGEMLRFHVRLRVTYHAGRTPKQGERPVNLGKFSVGEAVDRLKKLFEAKKSERQQEFQDLAAAKTRIRELERELRSKPVPKLQPPAVKTVQRKITGYELSRIFEPVTAAIARRAKASFDEIEAIVASKGNLLDDVNFDHLFLRAAAELNKVSGGEIQTKGSGSNPGNPHTSILNIQAKTHLRPIRPAAPIVDGDVKLKAGAVKMLKILAQWYPQDRSDHQLGILAGFAPSGDTFSEYIRSLTRAGFVAQRNGLITITDTGLKAAGDVERQPKSTDEIVNLWKPKFKLGAGKMLDVIVKHKSLSPEDLASISGYTQPDTFNEYLRSLTRAGLVEQRDGVLHATEALFP